MNQENPAVNEDWPEDQADWPHAVGVVQGGVFPIASVAVNDRESADLASAVQNVINKAEQKTGIRPDLVVTKHRHAAAHQEPFGYFRAEPFGWTDCAETDEGAVALYDQETVNALQGRCDELLSAAKAVVERWDSPLWKDLPPTAKAIARLRDAVNKLEGAQDEQKRT